MSVHIHPCSQAETEPRDQKITRLVSAKTGREKDLALNHYDNCQTVSVHHVVVLYCKIQ